MSVYAEISVVGSTEWFNPTLWHDAAVEILREIAVDAKNKTIDKINPGGMFKNPTGNLGNSVKLDFVDDGADLSVGNEEAPYALYQEKGVREHNMTYLIGAKNANTGLPSPIPIKTPGGKTIFAWPNADKINAGTQFHHPGYEGKYFFRDSVDEAIKESQAKYESIAVRAAVKAGIQMRTE